MTSWRIFADEEAMTDLIGDALASSNDRSNDKLALLAALIFAGTSCNPVFLSRFGYIIVVNSPIPQVLNH
jgi:hypothetical protein